MPAASTERKVYKGERRGIEENRGRRQE